MDDLNIRKIKSLSGLYSHPDISKFIYNVLLHFETPVNLNYLEKKNKKNNVTNNIPNNVQNNVTNNFEKQFKESFKLYDNNYLKLNNSDNLDLSNHGTFEINNTFKINNENNFDLKNDNLNYLNNNIHNKYNINNELIDTLLYDHDEEKNDLFYKEEIQNSSNFFIFDNSEIVNFFKCNVFINNNNFLFISRYLEDKKSKYETILPIEYIQIYDNIILDKFVFNISFLEIISMNKDPLPQKLFQEIHNFLTGFEHFLKNVFIKCYNNNNLKKFIHKDIINSITNVVLFVFNDQFNSNSLSFKINLINRNIHKKDFEWIKTLKFDSNYLSQYIDLDINLITNYSMSMFIIINNILRFYIYETDLG